MSEAAEVETHDVIVVGAGVSGIYQIHRLAEMGVDAIVLEADDDLGGTWNRNRYPGARFDSESYTYGYSFSKELLDEWHWKERFSGQAENLRYLNFVADRFDLRRHMRFGSRVTSMVWDEDDRHWTLRVLDGPTYRARFVVAGLGPLSAPTLPRIDGLDDFEGESWHTWAWPSEPVELAGKRVGVVGTGATGIQVISAIAGDVEELVVFQRRPNWSTPLNNSPISDEEMDAIRARYDEIFANCDRSPGGFEHVPDRRGFWSVSAEERQALWDELYDQPGFAFLASNFVEIFSDPEANAEVSAYVADRIRARVDDPETAEKLIPTDHGFGVQRLPLETNYFEVYNRDNVRLVDVSATPIERVTPTGVETTEGAFDLDVIVYATGFDAITGGYDRVDIRGVGGVALADTWRDGPRTLLGVLTHGFPNLFMVAGPQSVSGSTNFPRAIEVGVDWITGLLGHAMERGVSGSRRRRRPRRTGTARWSASTTSCCCAAARAGSPATTPTSPATRPARSDIRPTSARRPSTGPSSKRRWPRATRASTSPLPVDLAAMTDRHHQHDENVVANPRDHPVVTGSDSPLPSAANQLLRSRRSRIQAEIGLDLPSRDRSLAGLGHLGSRCDAWRASGSDSIGAKRDASWRRRQ